MRTNRPRSLKRQRKIRRIKFFHTCFKNATWPRYGLLGLTVLIGLFFVLQINITATKGYDIRELEQKIVQLEKEAKDLNLESVELQSMDRIFAQLSDYRLVQARPDAYISTGVTTVAAR